AITRSAPLAASAGVAATRTPLPARPAAFAGLRFHPVTSKPFATSWPAMPAPMMPSPSTDTFIGFLSLEDDERDALPRNVQLELNVAASRGLQCQRLCLERGRLLELLILSGIGLLGRTDGF